MLQIDFTAFGILLSLCFLSLVFYQWRKNFLSPGFLYSKAVPYQGRRASYESLPRYSLMASLLFFSLAFIDPHEYVRRESVELPTKAAIPTEGLAIYLVLDQSGSMAGEVKTVTPEGRRLMTKMDLLKKVTRGFVEGGPEWGLEGRPNDMLGLMSFARGAQVLSPLTLDHQAILNQLEQLEYVKEKEKDGTSIGYAILKSASLISATRHFSETLAEEGEPAYDIKSAVMILVTDGLQAPSPLDAGKELRNIGLLEAAEYAKRNDIRVYIVNVEPRLASQEFSAHRSLMKKVAELTGGKFYLVDSTTGLESIYADIDQLEKSVLPTELPKDLLPQLYRRQSYYPYFIIFGMLCLFSYVLLDGVVMRRVP